MKTVQEQKRAVGYVLCRPRKRNTRARTRGNKAITQRVVWVLSVTTGDMLQSPAAYKYLWSGIMSGPGYGDRCAKTVQKRKRAIGICFVAQGNETPEPGPAGIKQ